MGTIANQCKNKNISEGCQLHRFFRNKVYQGDTGELMKRKQFKTRKNQRKETPFYTNAMQDFRIQESLLFQYVNILLDEISKLNDIEIQSWNKNVYKDFFQRKHKQFMKKENKNLQEYIDFISDSINERNCQEYENIKLKKGIEQKQFEDIIEKIEVYPTGIVCIFNNGFELALQFQGKERH